MRSLNQTVIRTENLKKFSVVSEIGVGGQAKVFKVFKREQETGEDENTEKTSLKNNIFLGET